MFDHFVGLALKRLMSSLIKIPADIDHSKLIIELSKLECLMRLKIVSEDVDSPKSQEAGIPRRYRIGGSQERRGSNKKEGLDAFLPKNY